LLLRKGGHLRALGIRQIHFTIRGGRTIAAQTGTVTIGAGIEHGMIMRSVRAAFKASQSKYRFVFQQFFLFNAPNVAQNVLLSNEYSHSPKSREQALHLLENWNAAKAQRTPHSFRRRAATVAIARALLQNPQVILPMSPRVHSIPKRRARSWGAGSAQPRGQDVIVITHDLMWPAKCRRILWIETDA